jgi:hypothetical protein
MAIRNAMQKLQKQFAAKYGGNARTLSGVVPKNAVNLTPRPSPIPTLNSNTRLAQRPDVSRLNYASMPKPNTTGQNMINPFEQAQQYQGQAAGVFGQMTGFNAPQYQAPSLGSAPQLGQVSVGNLPTMAGANVSQYMSPYTQEVINRGMADIGRQQQQAMNVLGAQAGTGAFGGDRYQLAQAETAAQFGRQALDFGAQQRQQAFQQAQAQAQFDVQNQIARQQQEAAAERARQQYNVGQQTQRQLDVLGQQNLAQDEAYRRAIGQIGIRQQGATGIRGLGQEAFARGQFGLQQQQAAAQQQMQQQQQLLDAARAQTLTNLGYPQQSLTFGQGILGGLPSAKITESGSTGIFDILNLVGIGG